MYFIRCPAGTEFFYQKKRNEEIKTETQISPNSKSWKEPAGK
jgi:hypothetical protein